MLKLGITGGIGSGKSIICKIFSALGAPVYHADTRAHFLVEYDQELKKHILNLLGPEAYEGQKYNREYVARKVFADEGLMQQLNRIIHPAVEADFTSWAEAHSEYSYVVKEAAILFESGADKSVDRTVYIDAGEDIRVQRVVKRNHVSAESVRSRMKFQWPAEKIRPLADMVIENNGNTLILPGILKIHFQLISNFTHG